MGARATSRMSMHAKPAPARALAALLVAALAGPLAGCEGFQRARGPGPSEPQPVAPIMKHPVLGGTIGAQSYLGSSEMQRLRGFGLVVGLGENGSSDCPTAVRDYLVEYITKQLGPRIPGARRELSPSALIDSLDSAAVEVTGYVHAAAPHGSRFDLFVEALPGTSTKSLEGGLLIPCELRQFDASASGTGLMAGTVLGEAEGGVFVDMPAGDAEPGSERRGVVLGGGRSKVDGSARLLLISPSYTAARRLERRILERFGQRPPVAEAMSKGYIELKTPSAYADRPARFIELVTHLYVDGSPGFLDQRMRDLAALLVSDATQRDHISLVWEAAGRTSIPRFQPLYTHADAGVRYYAARAGLRLGDSTAVPILAELAASPSSEFRLSATRELGDSDLPQAAGRLVTLLDAEDQDVRIAAYEGLLLHRHPSVRSRVFPSALAQSQLNFVLDVVASHAKPMIYVRRSRMPRIAVFGEKLAMTMPLFYSHPDDSVTVNAVDASGDVSVFSKRGGKMSDPINVPPRVAELIAALADVPTKDDDGRVRGVGSSYSRVVQILAALTRDDTIHAPLILEQAGAVDASVPLLPPDRPEAEETAPPAPPGDDADRKE